MFHPRSALLPILVCVALLLAACGGATAPTSGSQTGSATIPGPSTGSSATRERPSSENSAASPAPDMGRAKPEAAPAAGGAPPPALSGDSTATDGAANPPPPSRDDPPATRRTPPSEPYDSTYFKNYGVNPFVDTWTDPLSTFAMDIDTASYGVMRRFIDDGNLPNPDSVRVEEYLNSFNYRYPQPDAGSNFAIYSEVAPSPWGGSGYEMVQIGIQGRAIAEADRAPTSLTFVIDVSGSMEREDRLETVKDALAMLVTQLRPDDTIGIVVYGSEASSVLPPTSGADKRRILDAIYSLAPSGATNVEAGLDIGFEQANEALQREGSNMILLCSDGVANNGVTDPAALVAKYERYTSQGIKLSTYGFGMGNYNDVLMEQLANAGNGFYSYIDTLDEARKLFVENLTGTLQLIARDAKIQVEFDPGVVERYRLVGYENRDVADQDFRDDAIDAGEVGAGHSVTALYEIKRYDDARDAAAPFATVRIRYHKIGAGQQVVEEQQAIAAEDVRRSFAEATPRFQLAVSVAQYAELLRHSRWARGSVLDEVVSTSRRAARDFEGTNDVSEFVRLVDRAAALAPAD